MFKNRKTSNPKKLGQTFEELEIGYYTFKTNKKYDTLIRNEILDNDNYNFFCYFDDCDEKITDIIIIFKNRDKNRNKNEKKIYIRGTLNKQNKVIYLTSEDFVVFSENVTCKIFKKHYHRFKMYNVGFNPHGSAIDTVMGDE